MKRICIVNGCAGYGGPERLIEDWAKHIDAARFTVDYVYTPYPGHESHAEAMRPYCREVIALNELVPLFFPRNIEPVAKVDTPDEQHPALKASFKARIWKALVPASVNEAVWYNRVTQKAAALFADCFQELKPDLFHFNVAVNNWISAAIIGANQARPGIPTFIHTHNPPVFHKPTSSDLKILQRVDHFTYVSKATSKQWDKLIRDKSRVSVIHNAVDINLFEDTIRPCSTNPNGAIHFGCCTRLSPMKAVDVVLEAAGLLEKEGIPFKLSIAGTGPDEKMLREQSLRLGLDAKVKFLGHCNDVKSILGQLDVYIQTSRSTEGLPISLLESMATGLPSIATEIGGTTEAIKPNTTGIIVPIEDPEAIAEAMKKFISDRSRVETMGASARALAESEFSMQRMVKEIEDRYESMMA